jgi:hypothetical protein
MRQPVAEVQYTFTHNQYRENKQNKTNNTKNNTKIHRATQKNTRNNTKIRKSAGRAPSLRVLPGICLTTEEKTGKNPSQGSHT